MNIIEKEINKTIVISYDDATRMIDFCNDQNGNVSKSFYDWFVKKEGEFFCKTGMLLIDGILKSKQKAAVSFDFTDPDKAIFCYYVYKDQSIICNWTFKREDNLTMKDITIDVHHFSFKNQQKVDILAPHDIKKEITQAINLAKRHDRNGFQGKSKKKTVEETVYKQCKVINRIACKGLTNFVYAMMYYVSQQEPEEITTLFHSEIDNTPGQKIKGIYEYTGYIDLRKTKVYKPNIEKDPDSPIREYNRHIQKWSVRGHYRRTKNGLIWIDPHTRGEGELEKRIYSTQDENELNIIPKVFEVERTIKDQSKKQEPQKTEKQKDNARPIKIQKPKRKKSFFTRIKSLWNKLFSR